MEIKAISNGMLSNVNFESKKKSRKEMTPIIVGYEPQAKISNAKMNTALKAMILIPITTGALQSCNKDVKIYDTCSRPTFTINQPSSKPNVPAVTDTLYMGHIYDLPAVKSPVRNLANEKTDTVIIPKAQAYIPVSLKESKAIPLINDFINILGLNTKTLKPTEGKNSTSVESLPLQIVYSNPVKQTVNALKFDGFNSVSNTLVYNENEYNAAGNIRSSKHYELTYIDDKTMYVEKSDNFRPEKDAKTEVWKINGDQIDVMTNTRDNIYEYQYSIKSGNNSQSIIMQDDVEGWKYDLSDIKIQAS